jgi:hypothetical protein
MAFPNVPDVPGVPALARSALDAADDLVLLVEDVASLLFGSAAPAWGIYQDGQPVVIADSVVSMGYKEDWSISTYPVEQGGFESYNKVQNPFLSRVRFATGGSTADKQAFLDSIASVISSTDLFDVVTPEVTYTSVNVTHQNYDRSALRGVGLLMVEVVCEQVRVTATAAFSNATSSSNGAAASPAGSADSTTTTDITVRRPQSASASPQVNAGTVQPVTPTDSQNASFSAALAAEPFNF